MINKRQKQRESLQKEMTSRLRNHPRIPFDFDWQEYLEVNPSLRKKGIENEMLVLRHYIKVGYRTGTAYKANVIHEVNGNIADSKTITKTKTEISPRTDVLGSFPTKLPNKFEAWEKHANLRINYEESFNRIVDMVRINKPFTFIRISDGEYHNLFWKASPDKKVDKETLEKVSSCLSYILERKMAQIKEGENSNLLVGMQHGTQYDVHFLGELKKYKSIIDENHNSSVFSWAYVTDKILDLFCAIKESGNPVVVVGPDYLQNITEFNISSHIKTSADYSWRDQNRIDLEVISSISKYTNDGMMPIVLYACSVSGKMLMSNMYRRLGDKIVQLDMGSNLDPYANVLTRGWQVAEMSNSPQSDRREPIRRYQGASKKAFFESLGDRVGSKINEELFVYAYCEKHGITFGTVVDPWEHTDPLCEMSRYELHKSLYNFLGLPQSVQKNFASDEEVEWVKITDEYTKYDSTDLFTESFIETLREKFYQNTENVSRENLENIVVAVHIRRGDVGINNKLRYTPNSYYLDMIDRIRKKCPNAIINIFSDTAYQNEENTESLDEFKMKGCNLFINLREDETWKKMINSDILIMSKSSFSWVPALYNKNFVIYQNCWLKKLNEWVSNEDIDIDEKIETFIKKRTHELVDETSVDWKKKGNIYNEHHAQLPVVDVLDDRLRIYYSTRKDGKSRPVYIEVNPSKGMKTIKRQSEYLLELGKPGSFDWSGVMPTSIVNYKGKKYMYYIGWSQRLDVPYHNTLGLAISNDGITWEKCFDGPVLGTSSKEPGYVGTADVLIDNGTWKMWYLSCRDWFEHEGIMEPLYDIKYASSEDGINWLPSGKTAIHLLEDEGGISASRVVKTKQGYEMFFSARKRTGYRERKDMSYRIFKASSKDGITWERDPNPVISTSPQGWDDFMVCYPFICTYKESTYLFYNGNGFGRSGIGYAVKQLETT